MPTSLRERPFPGFGIGCRRPRGLPPSNVRDQLAWTWPHAADHRRALSPPATAPAAPARFALHPVPPWASGALVHSVPTHTSHPVKVLWVPNTAPLLPFDRILLRWEPAPKAGWDITAHLGLAATVVPLAIWPAAGDIWPRLVRPTLREVTGLCSVLTVATGSPTPARRQPRPPRADPAGAALLYTHPPAATYALHWNSEEGTPSSPLASRSRPLTRFCCSCAACEQTLASPTSTRAVESLPISATRACGKPLTGPLSERSGTGAHAALLVRHRLAPVTGRVRDAQQHRHPSRSAATEPSGFQGQPPTGLSAYCSRFGR